MTGSSDNRRLLTGMIVAAVAAFAIGGTGIALTLSTFASQGSAGAMLTAMGLWLTLAILSGILFANRPATRQRAMATIPGDRVCGVRR